MGRRKKGSLLQDKIDVYLNEYKLDDLNQSNDMAALELNIEQIQEAIASVKKDEVTTKSKMIRDLISSLRDATQAWSSLQDSLGIARKKRHSEDEETPLSYIERLKTESKAILERRLKPMVCKKCGQVLGKYIIYVPQKGEEGSLAFEKKKVEDYKFDISGECWKCGDSGSKV